uniref:Transposon Ty3-G Gag-Pol polyprotein n=1 Tax=Cajanus cajan TaxID=3821 RepID=A0A151RF65_CAJCA|nr:Transposon Ty3-G Gag-Pol polyprotein [Cajanus cajan]
MSPAETQLRREKGLCFTCDDKYSPSHRCPNKQYLWLHLDEDEVSDEPVMDASVVTDNIEPQLLSEPHFSFNALNGSAGNGTMRFKGVINGLTVQILLDSGSSDNFLQPRIAACLKLPIEPIQNFNVMVGNGSAHISDYSNLSLKFMLDDNNSQDLFRDLPVDMEPEITLLLHTYQQVFELPLKPYRYPFSQKQQIEKMVHEMLQEGIIVPSNSPFSSPIILVKKKDGTWRFCTDYRALNAINVKDSFPIPTV